MKKNPHLVIISGFLVLIVTGSILLTAPWPPMSGERLPRVDALFMATSGTCVTGLSLINVGRDMTHAVQIVLLVMIHLGGPGS